MQIARHAAMFFVAQSEQLVGHAPQSLLDVQAVGDVFGHSHHADYAPFGVAQRKAPSVKMAQASGREASKVVLERCPVCYRPLHTLLGLGDIVGMDVRRDVWKIVLAFSVIDAENSIEIVGTQNCSQVCIHFPASHVDELFGLRQQRLAFAQFVFRLFLSGNVVSQQRNRRALAQGSADRQHTGVKPVATVFQVHGKFDPIGLVGRDHAVKNLAKREENVFPQNLHGMPTDKVRLVPDFERLAGAPHS